MCSHIQLSTRLLECTAQVASVIQPYIRARSPTESRNYNPDRDQSTVGADHPGLPTSVDRSTGAPTFVWICYIVTGLCCKPRPYIS